MDSGTGILGQFIFHTVVAVPGSVAIMLVIGLSLLMGGIRHFWGNNSWFGWMVWICGFLLGVLINGAMAQHSACFTWITGLIWIGCGVLLVTQGGRNYSGYTGPQ